MQKSSLISFLLVFTALLLFSACSGGEQPKDKDDILLAKAYNKKLFLSELEGMVPTGSSREDSALIVDAYIERWVRESLLMHEAEKNISKDLNLDELVRDYRASLIRHNYEKLIVELQMDSTINEQEFEDYYQENKEQYVLDQDIIRAHFIKMSIEEAEQEDFQDWWEDPVEENFKLLLEYCAENATVYLFDDSIWYKVPDILRQLPKDAIRANNLQAGKDYSFSDEYFGYRLRVFEKVKKNERAPRSYVSEHGSKVILHQRRLKLLEEKKEEIYERETRLNNARIFAH